MTWTDWGKTEPSTSLDETVVVTSKWWIDWIETGPNHIGQTVCEIVLNNTGNNINVPTDSSKKAKHFTHL